MKLNQNETIATPIYGLLPADAGSHDANAPISLDFSTPDGVVTLSMTRAEARKLGEQLRMLAALGGEP